MSFFATAVSNWHGPLTVGRSLIRTAVEWQDSHTPRHTSIQMHTHTRSHAHTHAYNDAVNQAFAVTHAQIHTLPPPSLFLSYAHTHTQTHKEADICCHTVTHAHLHIHTDSEAPIYLAVTGFLFQIGVKCWHCLCIITLFTFPCIQTHGVFGPLPSRSGVLHTPSSNTNPFNGQILETMSPFYSLEG